MYIYSLLNSDLIPLLRKSKMKKIPNLNLADVQVNRNRIMKKLYLTLIVTCFITLSASAQSPFQKGDLSLGGSLLVGGDETTLVGIGLKVRYNVTDPIRLEGSLSVFPKQDHLSMTDFSAFFHYLFPVSSKVVLYPLAGLGNLKLKASYDYGSLTVSASKNYFNFRLGGGIDVLLTENCSLNGELKAHFIDGGYVKMFSAGVMFRF